MFGLLSLVWYFPFLPTAELLCSDTACTPWSPAPTRAHVMPASRMVQHMLRLRRQAGVKLFCYGRHAPLPFIPQPALPLVHVGRVMAPDPRSSIVQPRPQHPTKGLEPRPHLLATIQLRSTPGSGATTLVAMITWGPWPWGVRLCTLGRDRRLPMVALGQSQSPPS